MINKRNTNKDSLKKMHNELVKENQALKEEYKKVMTERKKLENEHNTLISIINKNKN